MRHAAASDNSYSAYEPDMLLRRGESRFEVVGIYGEEQTLRSAMLAEFSVALQEIF